MRGSPEAASPFMSQAAGTDLTVDARRHAHTQRDRFPVPAFTHRAFRPLLS
jgi:hypothetical protein